ncbi:MAG: methionyl-tRNA formyltransferase [Rubrivivax sp.]|nr:methionyl-tRNA formyltransferase [Rubrivivax sp.]
MRIAFAGTPEFARAALEALLAAGHEVALVLTQPDRPAGRGLQLQASPVKALAARRGLPVVQPRSLRLDGKFAEDARAAAAALRSAAPQLMVVAAYGLILPPWVLALPPAGCLNIHASLLPRWRGAAPIQRAIEAGDSETGITIMQMDAGLDTGAMLLEQATPIGPDDTAATLHDRLAALGAELVVQALARLPELQARPCPQPAAGATYAAKIDKAEAAIDWRQGAAAIERRLRAFDPFPGASAEIAGRPLKVWRARVAEGPADGQALPGSLLPAPPGRLLVACGERGSEALELLEVQAPGGRRGPVREWLQRAGLHAT